MKNQIVRLPAIFLFRAVVSKVREFDQSLVHDEPCLSNLLYVSRVHAGDSVSTSRDRWRWGKGMRSAIRKQSFAIYAGGDSLLK